MSIRMDHYLDKIRVIKAAGRLLKQRIGKLPIRGPEFPEQTANFTSVLFKAGSTPFGVKVPLIPTFVFLSSGGGFSIVSDGLDVVSANPDQTCDLDRPKNDHNACCPRTQVVTGQARRLEFESVD